MLLHISQGIKTIEGGSQVAKFGLEFSPVIIEGDELRTWRPNVHSESDFGFVYGNLTGEHWYDNLHTVFHPNDNPYITDDISYIDGYFGEVVIHEEDTEGASAPEIVREAARLLLKEYHPSWVIREFNKQQAEAERVIQE